MVKGNGRKYNHLKTKECVSFYSPCDTNKRGGHVRVKRCKKYVMGHGWGKL